MNSCRNSRDCSTSKEFGKYFANKAEDVATKTATADVVWPLGVAKKATNLFVISPESIKNSQN